MAAQDKQPILDAGTDDLNKPLVEASNPELGTIYIHENQILHGYGKNKSTIISSYKPQNGISGKVESANFDIVINPQKSNEGISIIDDIILELNINLNSGGATSYVTLKPVHQWFEKVDISNAGGNIIQTIYFDHSFTNLVNNTFTDQVNNMKSQINTDPRNFLPWFDLGANSPTVTVDGAGAVTTTDGNAGKSTFLSQPYFYSSGANTGAVGAGTIQNYNAYAKGGYLACGNDYTFYLPIDGNFLQSSEIFMPALNTEIRFRFYMNSEIKQFDSETALSSLCVANFNSVTMWVRGSRLAQASFDSLMLKYQNPVVSNFAWYNEIVSVDTSFTAGQPFDLTLATFTGLCTKLTFWLEDTRSDILYPTSEYDVAGSAAAGTRYYQGNMMTLPISEYLFIKENGSSYGTGQLRQEPLLNMLNSYQKAPKSAAYDERLYFRKYYEIDFSKNLLALENVKGVYSGGYMMTSREVLRIKTPAPPSVELNGFGNAVDGSPTTALYSNCKLHVVGTFLYEIIEKDGMLETRPIK